MATNAWKCYRCGYVGPTAEFGDNPGDGVCPRESCKEEDDIFPHRIFHCLSCKFEADQNTFFDPEYPLDSDPTEEREGWVMQPHSVDGDDQDEECAGETWAQVS